MIFVNLTVILLYGMLALLSRKNFSKYKGMGRLFLAMGDTACSYFEGRFHVNGNQIRNRLRRVQVVTPARLYDLTRLYAVKNAAACLGVLFALNLISGAVGIAQNIRTDSDNIIEREDYQGNTREHDIYLSIDGEESVYVLQVAPVEYTEEEFFTQAAGVFAELENTMLGENENARHIYSNLNLAGKDSTGVFSIQWTSDYPEYITSFGEVRNDELEQDVEVAIRARVSYLNYSAEQTYLVTLCAKKGNVEDSKTDIAGQSLDRLEQENRNNRTFVIPNELSGVTVSLRQNRGNQSIWILLLVVPCSFGFIMLRSSRLKDKVHHRDNTLTRQYPRFVNKLSLLIGTGMTLKAGLKQFISEAECKSDILVQEISYSLHEIDMGMDEASAYEQLGVRLALPSYTRLMNHISQNLRLGTGDLIRLMEDEVRLSMELKIELARKKGEEASAKLVFPMIILLAVIMIIVILPAMTQF